MSARSVIWDGVNGGEFVPLSSFLFSNDFLCCYATYAYVKGTSTTMKLTHVLKQNETR